MFCRHPALVSWGLAAEFKEAAVLALSGFPNGVCGNSPAPPIESGDIAPLELAGTSGLSASEWRQVIEGSCPRYQIRDLVESRGVITGCCSGSLPRLGSAQEQWVTGGL